MDHNFSSALLLLGSALLYGLGGSLALGDLAVTATGARRELRTMRQRQRELRANVLPSDVNGVVAGVKVADVAALVEKLKNEAKVIQG